MEHGRARGGAEGTKCAAPSVPGARNAITSANGDYIVPFLPTGDYEVVFELQGFTSVKRTGINVGMAATRTLDVSLTIAALTETVTVTGQAAEVVLTPTIASTFKKETLELLPVGRALNDAVLLAPGVAGNGPSGNIMIAGALSYESQYLVNGVVINENLRGQALSLFIEDAVQETKVSTGAISAEYGRFGGGVVNMVTKSGGNTFSGSFRTTFNNDGWRALTPYPTDETVDALTPIYEGTLGGPVLRDRIWFFGAGRYTKPEQSRTLAVTGLNQHAAQQRRIPDLQPVRNGARAGHALGLQSDVRRAAGVRRLSARAPVQLLRGDSLSIPQST